MLHLCSCSIILVHRFLENDFILVQAKLLVPSDYVARKVSYKYVVFKAKSKEKDKYVWDRLVGWGEFTNRCLQIPRDRCKPGGILC